MPEFQALLGIVAGLFTIPATVLYIRAILKRDTVPERATWLIWTVAGWIIFLSYRTVPGSEWNIWVSLSYAFSASIIFLFSIKFGIGGWTPFDKRCFLASGISLVLWGLFRSLPIMPILINIGVDFACFLPTLRKTAVKPWTENRLAWTVGFAGSILNLVAAKSLSFAVLTLPAYYFLGGVAMMFLLFRPRVQPSVKRWTLEEYLEMIEADSNLQREWEEIHNIPIPTSFKEWGGILDTKIRIVARAISCQKVETALGLRARQREDLERRYTFQEYFELVQKRDSLGLEKLKRELLLVEKEFVSGKSLCHVSQQDGGYVCFCDKATAAG